MSEPKKHNPSNLSAEQIGTAKGWRLLDEDEITSSERGMLRAVERWEYSHWDNTGWQGEDNRGTYRTKLSRAELRKARGLPEEPAKAPEVSEIARNVADSFFDETSGAFEEAVASISNAITEATAAKDAEIARLKEERTVLTRDRDRWCDSWNKDTHRLRAERDALAAELERAKEAAFKAGWAARHNTYFSDIGTRDQKLAQYLSQPQPERTVKSCLSRQATNPDVTAQPANTIAQCFAGTTGEAEGSNASGQSDPAPLAESKCNCAVGDYHSPGCPVLRDTGEAKRAAIESQLAAVTAERDEFVNKGIGLCNAAGTLNLEVLQLRARAETAERKLAEAMESLREIRNIAISQYGQSLWRIAGLAAEALAKGAA